MMTTLTEMVVGSVTGIPWAAAAPLALGLALLLVLHAARNAVRPATPPATATTPVDEIRRAA